jgi:hypothetical protein
MPRHDPGVYLEDIEHNAAAAVRFTSGFSLERYLADEKIRAAGERVLEVCGEAMSNLLPSGARRCGNDSSRPRHHRVPQHSRAWLCGARSQQGLQHSNCACAIAPSRRAGGVEGIPRSTIATVID